MRYLKAAKHQHTEWKNWHTEKTPFGERKKKKKKKDETKRQKTIKRYCWPQQTIITPIYPEGKADELIQLSDWSEPSIHHPSTYHPPTNHQHPPRPTYYAPVQQAVLKYPECEIHFL